MFVTLKIDERMSERVRNLEDQRQMQVLSVDQLVGKTFGEYQIERLLGDGKSSAVYLARQQTHANAALITTFILPETFSAQARERFMARFEQEGSALVKLRHPHILPTYAVSEQFGYPYLVTSFVQGSSLAHMLKRKPRLVPEYTAGLLKQIAAGLDYAHGNGVMHGTLSPAHIYVSSEQGKEGIQVAGLGLMRMLEMYGIEQNNHPYPRLFSFMDTFLGTPEYVAPERVQGGPVDVRADVYSLGIILFELLSGTLPFSGTDPLEVAMKRLQQPVASLHELCPDVPAALDLVVQRTLERDPAKRFQSAGEVSIAFERVLKVLGTTERAPDALGQATRWDPQVTLPPTVNWFDEEMISSGKRPLTPPAITSQVATRDTPTSQSASKHIPDGVDALAIDPFAWWWASAAKTQAPAAGTFTPSTTARVGGSRPTTRRRPVPAMKQRRQLVALLATGGVMGMFGVGSIVLAHLVQSPSMQPAQTTNVQPTSTMPPYHARTPVTTPGPTKSAQQPPKPAPTPTTTTVAIRPTPTATSAPKPTPIPTRQPTPTPRHSGTVIGKTNQPTNSATSFTYPVDGNASLLIHLPNGNFVACEQACTHAGVPVNYDPGSHTLVCPAHGAVFDPSNGFSVQQGPANSPLPGVSISINADGTITVK